MFYDTAFVRQLATKWRIDTPIKLRQKMHPFATNKDPLSMNRIARIFTFLSRNGIVISSDNIIRLINLCKTAAEECRSQRRKTCLLTFIVMVFSAIAAALTPKESFFPLFLTFCAVVGIALIVFIAAFARTVYQNARLIAFQRDLQIASCNWEKCINGTREYRTSNGTVQMLLDTSWIVFVSKKWNSSLDMKRRIWLSIVPDSYQSVSRIMELPHFLKSCGMAAADTDMLLELCDAAMKRTERISSYFIAFAISFLASSVFEFTTEPNGDIICTLLLSMAAALIACAILAALLTIPQREWIRVARFKADLITAKSSGLLD